MIDWEFHFERGTVALESDEFFDATRQSNCRWYRKLHFEEAAELQSFEILYEHKDGRYLLLRYEDCRRDVMPHSEKEFWLGPRPATGRVVSVRDAVLWMLAAQHKVPERLRRLMQLEEAPKQEHSPRTPDYWLGRVTIGVQANTLAVEVDWLGFAKRTYSKLVGLIHLLAANGKVDTPEVEVGLFNRYRVTVDTWWGGDQTIPPLSVTIDQVPGAPEEREFLTPLLSVRDLLRGPAACLRARINLRDTDEAPTTAELDLARKELVECLPAFRNAAIELKLAVARFEQRRQDSDTPVRKAEVLSGQEKKRTRTRLIDAERRIERELIEHIRAARDLAINTKDSPDGPRLLPRMTRSELARLASVRNDQVTRVLDMQGTKAVMLWNAAENLELLMRVALPRQHRQTADCTGDDDD